ncbi:BLUF domain-containing protein [Stenotrophomonas bentonitica]|uniref:BLUF domain-containing protein n=1 Tax=Stenotrophomonas bentonitica TaxID=1450134 RepID=UPI0031B9E059
MPLRAVVYTSERSEGVTGEQAFRLAADAERFNRLAGVTGVLLSDGQRFLQYFEGPEDGVSAVYARVQAS